MQHFRFDCRGGRDGKHIAASSSYTMGDETKENELRHGNDDPLHATRKPTTAESVDERPAQVAEMPTAEEVARRRRARARTRQR